MGLHARRERSVAVFRHGVEDGVLDKDADRSAYEGGEEVNVDVIPRAVEPSFFFFFFVRREEGCQGVTRTMGIFYCSVN